MPPTVTRAAAPLLAEIRSATAAAHLRVEGQVNLSIPWDRDRYLRFLRATLAVVAPTEQALRDIFGDARFPLLTSAADRLRLSTQELMLAQHRLRNPDPSDDDAYVPLVAPVRSGNRDVEGP